MRKNVLWLLLVTVGLLFFIGCDDDDNNKSGASVPYDPSRPVEFASFLPDSGGIRSKFIVKGKNFGNDISKVQVLFDGTRKAVVLAVDGSMIYCIAPKQRAGANPVCVVVNEKDTAFAEKKFIYNVSEAVSTVAGTVGNGGNNAGLEDGSLTTSRFNAITGLAYVGDETLLAFQTGAPAVRLVSIKDNNVTTLHSGFSFSSPGTTNTKSAVYAVTRSEHRIYRFSRNNMWRPEKLGIVANLGAEEVWDCTFADTDDYLYMIDTKGRLVRVKLAEGKVYTSDAELLTDKGEWGEGYICYNHEDDHFYITSRSRFGIYRVSKDGKTIEQYAGFNGTGHTDDYVQDVQFNQPTGICVDSEGNMYITCIGGDKEMWISKITLKEGYVSTVAGRGKGTADGLPLEASFNYPYSCVCDEEDNVYIGERWGHTIRKYAIE